MSRLRAPLLLLPIVASACAVRGPGAAAVEPVRVVSFNIRYGTAPDGDDHWRLRRDDVVATILRNRPAILGVQEALAFQVEVLAAALPGHLQLGVGRDGADRGEYSALFVDAARFEVLRSGTEWFGDAPATVGSRGWDAALPRIVTWAELRDRATDARLAVLNMHFDHRGEQARVGSARQIVGMLDRFPGLPVVVMGDLNTGEASEPLAVLRGAGLRDTFRVVHPAADQVGTFGGFRGRVDGAKIDYVLCNDRCEVREAWIDRATRADGRDPSDHFPVGAVLALPVVPGDEPGG